MSAVTRQNALRCPLVLLVAWAAALTSCGGGGGGGPDNPPASLIALTAANRDTVAHAAAGSLLALGATSAVPVLDGAGGVAWRETPQARTNAPARPLAMLLGSVVRSAMNATAASGRETQQAVVANPPQACSVGGTMTVTLDDLDNNGVPSLGEPVAIVFNHCQDTPSEVIDGKATVTITSGTQTSFSATMSLSQLSSEATNGRHGLTLDGVMTLGLTTLSATSDRLVLTASGPVTAAIHTHLPFSDTVTLQSGFAAESTYDSAGAVTVTTTQGTLASVAAGGAVSIATDIPVRQLDADAYPYAGVMRISGQKGVMLVTALSTSQVRIDLDADGDGSYESTVSPTWDWLL
jgi:hypothetical protein